MKTEVNEISINGVVYVPKGAQQFLAPSVDGLQLVIIRAARSGVHYGYMKSREGQEVVLANARRIWYWAGACSLSQLALNGTKKPDDCKFSVPVQEITVFEVIEIIPVSTEAKNSIDGVTPWKQ